MSDGSAAAPAPSWRLPKPAPPPKPAEPEGIDPSFVPKTKEELARCLADPYWRVCSGQLYKIMLKEAGSDEATTVPFRPNRAQRRFLKRLWTRNLVLKARQMGYTTLACILFLDHALFNADQRCGIVAQDTGAAESIFRDKVKFAYENLPLAIRQARPLVRDSADELLFNHNSSIRVATSMRSGTIHRLHVSEFGKIGAKYPDKAKEVVTGSLPAVPLDGVAIIESTAEGQDGEFFKMAQRAMQLAQQGKQLTARDYRFHFSAWWEEPGYRLPAQDAHRVIITAKDHEYFDEVEAKTGTTLDQQQRAWYVATRDNDFGGDPAKMWQEYPSYPSEAFQVSSEGAYYSVQLTAARNDGRIGMVPHFEGRPVNTFWDIGASDGTAVWLHQEIGTRHRFIGFIEGWGESYAYFIRKLQALGYIWGTHYLPHDAKHKRQQAQKVAAPLDELRALKLGGNWVTVPAVDDINHGIQRTRTMFSQACFDETRCKDGLAHLASYRKTWNKAQGAWSSTPDKSGGHSEAADALRQWAQGYKPKKEHTQPAQTDTDWRA